MVVKWGKIFHRSVSKVHNCVALSPICTKFYPGHQSVQYCVSFDTNLYNIV